MKLRAGDPGCGPNVEVYLDGVLQTNVFEADEEAGRIVHAVEVDGRLQLNAAKTEVLRRIRYGRVRIRMWSPNPPPRKP